MPSTDEVWERLLEPIVLEMRRQQVAAIKVTRRGNTVHVDYIHDDPKPAAKVPDFLHYDGCDPGPYREDTRLP